MYTLLLKHFKVEISKYSDCNRPSCNGWQCISGSDPVYRRYKVTKGETNYLTQAPWHQHPVEIDFFLQLGNPFIVSFSTLFKGISVWLLWTFTANFHNHSKQWYTYPKLTGCQVLKKLTLAGNVGKNGLPDYEEKI